MFYPSPSAEIKINPAFRMRSRIHQRLFDLPFPFRFPFSPFLSFNEESAGTGTFRGKFLLNANLLPIFPKQTQLQKSTLKIQMPPSILSLETYPPRPKAVPFEIGV